MSWGAEFPRSTVPRAIYVERSHWLFKLRCHFGARSERHTWPTADEHSFGSWSGRRDAFGLIPDVVGWSKMYNALRD